MTTLPQTTRIQLPRPAGSSGLAVTGAHAPVAPAGGMSAGDVWRVLRTHLWLIVLSLVLGGLLGFGINLYLQRNYSRYTATGWVQVSPRPYTINDQAGVSADVDINTLAVEQKSQAALLRTDTLLNSVLNRPAVRDTSWFKQFVHTGPNGAEAADIAQAKQDLDDKLSVNPQPESKLIQVQFSYSNPEDCKTIVEELVSQHLDDQSTLKVGALRARIQDLNLTKSALTLKSNHIKDEIAKLQGELAKQGIITNGQLGQSPLAMQMSALATQNATAQGLYQDADSKLKQFQASLDKGEDPADVDEAIQMDPRILALREQVDQLQTYATNLGVGPNNPRSQQMQQQLITAQKQLADVEAERRVTLRSNLKAKLEQAKAAADATMQSISQKISDLKDTQGELDFKLFTFFQDKQDQEATDAQVANIDRTLENIDYQSHGKELAPIMWAQHPERPELPSFPKLPITMAASISIALALSLAIAFSRELMDQSVRSPRDITRVGQMNLLGMIPHEDDDPQIAGVPLPMVIFQAPTSIIAEQFRQVRTRLQQAASLDTTRSILVTSPGPGDGKSTIASNLAAGLALNGRRILLVDANFRRPQIHKIYNVGNELGFSSALAAIENFETAVHQTNVPNLDVLPTGPKPANPTELMESQLLIDFIEKALEEYDHVIFDSGPLLFVSETVALAPRVDGVVTVVRARANSRGLLQRMRDGLRQLKAEHLGIILNAVEAQGGGYYGRNIKTYYEYQNGHAH